MYQNFIRTLVGEVMEPLIKTTTENLKGFSEMKSRFSYFQLEYEKDRTNLELKLKNFVLDDIFNHKIKIIETKSNTLET